MQHGIVPANLFMLNAAITALFDCHPDKAALGASFKPLSSLVLEQMLAGDISDEAIQTVKVARTSLLKICGIDD